MPKKDTYPRLLRAMLAGAVCLLAGGDSSISWGDQVAIEAQPGPDNLRLVFLWPDPVDYSASFSDGLLYIDFSRPIDEIPNLIGVGNISSARLENGGKRLKLDITGAQSLRPVSMTDSPTGNMIAIDILSDPQAGTRQIIQGLSVGSAQTPSAAPISGTGQPQIVAQSDTAQSIDLSNLPPAIQADTAQLPVWPVVDVQSYWQYHGNIPRLIFDWPITATFRAHVRAYEASVRFDAPARISGLHNIRMSGVVADIQAVTEDQSTLLTVKRNPGKGSFHISSSDGRLIIDMVTSTRSQSWETTGVLSPTNPSQQDPVMPFQPPRDEEILAENGKPAPISPVYIGGRLGVSWMRLSRIHDVSMNREHGPVIVDQRDAPVFGADIALGLSGIESGNPLRMEIAYLYRGPFAYDPSQAVSGGTEASIDGQVTAHALMTNAYLDLSYDPDNRGDWAPYVMAGIGASLNMAEANIRDVEAGKPAGEVSDDDIYLAWGLGGGLSYPISQHMRFDSGYRYLRLGGTSFGPSERLSKGDRLLLKVRRIESHEFSVGLRYAFP